MRGGLARLVPGVVRAVTRRIGFRRGTVTLPRTVTPASTPPRPTIEWQYRPGGDQESRVGVFRDLLALFPPGRLLDLGCGTGQFSVQAHDMGW